MKRFVQHLSTKHRTLNKDQSATVNIMLINLWLKKGRSGDHCCNYKGLPLEDGRVLLSFILRLVVSLLGGEGIPARGVKGARRKTDSRIVRIKT